MFDAGAEAKKASNLEARKETRKHIAFVAPRRMALARSVPGLAKTPSPVAPVPSDPSPSGNDDDDDDDEEEDDAAADAAANPSVSIAPTASGDSNACSLDETLTGTELARIRDDPGVDSRPPPPAASARPNDAQIRERRRRAVAFARALIDGDGGGGGRGGVGAKRWARASGAKASDGDGGDGKKKRRRLPAGWAPLATRTRW